MGEKYRIQFSCKKLIILKLEKRFCDKNQKVLGNPFPRIKLTNEELANCTDLFFENIHERIR